MNEGKLREQAQRASRAKQILENDLVVEAFDLIEKRIYESWQTSSADETTERENAYLMHRLLQNFRTQFTQAIAKGKVADRELLSISKIRR